MLMIGFFTAISCLVLSELSVVLFSLFCMQELKDIASDIIPIVIICVSFILCNFWVFIIVLMAYNRRPYSN